MTDTRNPAHWHKLAEDARAGRLTIPLAPPKQMHLDDATMKEAAERAVRRSPLQLSAEEVASFVDIIGGQFAQFFRQHDGLLLKAFAHDRDLSRAYRRREETIARRAMSKRAFRRWRARRRAAWAKGGDL